MLLFYANDGLLALPQTDHLQSALDVLTGLFGRYGLHTNVNKMVGIVFETYDMAIGNSETAYDRIMMEVGPFFFGTATGAGLLSGLRGIFGGGISGGTPPISLRYGLGRPVGGNCIDTGPQAIKVLFIQISRIYRAPIGGI